MQPVVLGYPKPKYVGSFFLDLSVEKQLVVKFPLMSVGVTSLGVGLKYLSTVINICEWTWVSSFLFGEVIKYEFNFVRKHGSIQMTYSFLCALWPVSSFKEIIHLIQAVKFIGIDF